MFAEDDEEDEADEWQALLEQGWATSSATKAAERNGGDKPSADVESLGAAALEESIAEDDAGQCDSKNTSGAGVLGNVEISDAEEEAEEEVVEETGEEGVEEEVEQAVADSSAPMPPTVPGGKAHVAKRPPEGKAPLAKRPPHVGKAPVAKTPAMAPRPALGVRPTPGMRPPEGKAPLAKRPPHVGKAPLAKTPASAPRPALGVRPTLGMRPQQPAPAGVGGAASSTGPRAPRPHVIKVGDRAKGCGKQAPPLRAAPRVLHGVAAAASGPTSGVEEDDDEFRSRQDVDAFALASMLAAKAEGGKGGPGGKQVAASQWRSPGGKGGPGAQGKGGPGGKPAAWPVGHQTDSKGKGRGAAVVARGKGMAGRGRGAGGAALQPVPAGFKGSGKAGKGRGAGVARIQATAGPRTGAPGAPGRKPMRVGDLPEEVQEEAKHRAAAKVRAKPGASRLSEKDQKKEVQTWAYILLKRYADTGTWEPSRKTKKMARSANRFLGRAAGQRQDVKRNGKRKRADDEEWLHGDKPAEKPAGGGRITQPKQTVVVDMANVGAAYAKKVLGKKDGERNLFAWEGIRQCVNYLRTKGFKVVGVIAEDFRGPETRTGSFLMPDDIRCMCQSVEETPRLTGKHQRSADDEQVIRCAYNRKCFILGNDNFRDWMQQLKDKDIRDWYNQNRDIVHMNYYFDSGLGKFELLQGNVPDYLLASGKPVDKRELWTAP